MTQYLTVFKRAPRTKKFNSVHVNNKHEIKREKIEIREDKVIRLERIQLRTDLHVIIQRVKVEDCIKKLN